MAKYEYAYYKPENDYVSIEEICSACKKDPHIYVRHYDSHLFRPECKQAKLIVVFDAKSPFFRGAPNSAHEQGCDYIRPEYVPSTTEVSDTANVDTILGQLRRALDKTVDREDIPVNHAERNGDGNNNGNGGSLAHRLLRKKMAQRLIEILPKTREPELPQNCVYYGRVKCSLDVVPSHYYKDELYYHCDFRSIDSNVPLLTMNMTSNTWNTIPKSIRDLLSDSTVSLRISFLGEATPYTRHECHVVLLKNADFLMAELLC